MPSRPAFEFPLVLATTLLLVAFPGVSLGQGIGFEDVTEKAGLVAPLLGIMGHGAAFGDVDGDGLLDLYVGGFADRPNEEYAPAKAPPANVLLRNLGDGRFEPWAQEETALHARTSGAVFADLDNDGDAELLVANNCKGKANRTTEPQRTAQLTRSRLFENEGGRLVDVSARSSAALDQIRTARNVGVFDHDADGLLDLLVLEDRFTKNPRSVLLRNQGGLVFKEINEAAKLPDGIFGLGLAVADINGDTRADFFVGHSNRFFLSQEDGTYAESERLNAAFAWEPLDGEDWPCGAAFGDLNRDGLLDLVLSIHGVKARNRVYLHQGVTDGIPEYRDVTTEVGLPDHLEEKSPHVEIQDFDNDGWPDLYFSTARLGGDGEIAPLLYRNLGADEPGGLPRFHAEEGEGSLVYFPAGPSGDFDNDGRIDLFLVNWFHGNHCRLLRNTSPGENHWLRVRVCGRSFNREGIGSQIRIFSRVEGRRELLGFQELGTGYGYASGQDPSCHFGLGKATEVEVEVRLPNGEIVRRESLSAIDQILTIEE